jgi:hypothetical protein
MHNYSIYIIESPSTNKVYIGSTTQELKLRLSQHKSNYKNLLNGKGKKKCTSYEIIRYDDCTIRQLEYLENIKIINASEKEYDYIQHYKNDSKYICVNKQSPLTNDEKVKLNKYY